jgi:ABC-2 type transport system permease protein
MKGLLAIEWLKIKSYRTVWILSGIFITAILLFNILIDADVLVIGGGKAGFNILNSDYTFSSVWLNITYWAKTFTGLIALMFVILTTNEYQFRTNRQNVIDGWKRIEFFHAKWFLMVTVSVALTLFLFLLGFTFAMIHGSSISSIGLHIERLLFFFILTLNYFGLALTLSFLLKKTGLTIIIFILYAYPVETLFYLISTNSDGLHYGYYLPMESSAGLLPFTMPEIAKQVIPKDEQRPTETVFMLVSLVYVAIYYFAGRWKLLKGDW